MVWVRVWLLSRILSCSGLVFLWMWMRLSVVCVMMWVGLNWRYGLVWVVSCLVCLIDWKFIFVVCVLCNCWVCMSGCLVVWWLIVFGVLLCWGCLIFILFWCWLMVFVVNCCVSVVFLFLRWLCFLLIRLILWKRCGSVVIVCIFILLWLMIWWLMLIGCVVVFGKGVIWCWLRRCMSVMFVWLVCLCGLLMLCIVFMCLIIWVFGISCWCRWLMGRCWRLKLLFCFVGLWRLICGVCLLFDDDDDIWFWCVGDYDDC